MADKPMKIPGPGHPISIEANPSRVVITIGGKIIADTSDALTLREASYPAVQYIPRRDVDMAALTRSEHSTYCPYKGDASYYSIAAGGDRSLNAVWTYETPFEAMAQIKDYVAFYPDRVDAISLPTPAAWLWWLGPHATALVTIDFAAKAFAISTTAERDTLVRGGFGQDQHKCMRRIVFKPHESKRGDRREAFLETDDSGGRDR